MSKLSVSRVRVFLAVSTILFLMFAFAGYSDVGSQFFASYAVSSPCVAPARPVFAWEFGYIGDVYWPQANNSVTPSEMISATQSIGTAVGITNLFIVGAIDVEPGHNIQQSNVSTIKSYVDSLLKYSSLVFGRMDMEQFTNATAITKEITLFRSMDVNGVFMDLAPILYARMGQTKFNEMMQGLTTQFPNECFLLNQTSPIITITPLHGMTWNLSSYVSPTISPGSTTAIADWPAKVQKLNSLYPGRVVIHYDANAGLGTSEPMAYFAQQTPAKEESAIHTLALEGYNYYKANSNERFNVLFPVFGAWTAKNSKLYLGTLYNSLSVGEYNRDTLNTSVASQPSLLTTMVAYA